MISTEHLISTTMVSSDNLFEDIEQDNNPSFYGNLSILHDPYGRQKDSPQNQQGDFNHVGTSEDLVNSQIGLSNQIHKLIHDPNLKVDVVSSERLVNSSVIVYSIRLALFEEEKEEPTVSIIVKRRYSEFKSLRDNLVKLYPTTVIPPIPEKHSIFAFLANSINNNNELDIIEMRRRSFKAFLNDLIFESDEELKDCVLLHKFLDPSYELGWYMAVMEPPVSLLPKSLLLANPLDPTDQNGLYTLLPSVNGFEMNSTVDSLNPLRKLNEDLKQLKDQITLFDIKGADYVEMKKHQIPSESMDDASQLTDVENIDGEDEDHLFDPTLLSSEYTQFTEIPKNLIHIEIKFHHIIKILSDLEKLNSRSVKNYKTIVNTLIELGGNLNNFSLQIYESASYRNGTDKDNTLSMAVERFGSTIDSNFLNFESFLANSLVPEWQEAIHRMVQYYVTALSLIKFYKYKIIQFKLLYKLRFNKLQELLNLTSTGTNVVVNNDGSNKSAANLDHLKDLNSPSINRAIQRMEHSKRRGNGLSTKKSWYGLFGGNNGYNKQYSNTLLQADSGSVREFLDQLKFKINQIEKELNKFNQLIELINTDMLKLTEELGETYKDFLAKMERKWLALMISYIRNGRKLFKENELNWSELREFLKEDSKLTESEQGEQLFV